jgi:hypothetical protein
VELVAGDVLGLGSVDRLEVDDRELLGVEAADQVDPPVYGDARCDVYLDLLLECSVCGISAPWTAK